MSIQVSGSYVQTERHAKVSDKFNVIQASSVGEAMANQGLSLVSLSTGRAKHPDKIDFQRTLSRYRGPQIGEGIYIDLVYDSKHMGRGVDNVLLGIYRMICTNGLFVGKNFFSQGIRHNGNTYENLGQGISAALAMQDTLAKSIERMQSIQLTSERKEAFALEAVKLLAPSDAIQVRHRLLTPRREIDRASDLWTVYNMVQENGMAGRTVAYTLKVSDKNGHESIQQRYSRQVKPNSGKDANFNQALFDVAEKFAA